MTTGGKGGRPIGSPKTGGRERGTPNKATKSVAEKLDALGCDPIEGLARLATDDDNPVEIRMRCFIELAQYKHPKRRPTDGEQRECPVINLNNFADTSGDSSDVRGESQSESSPPTCESV
jgi:hypothetical protein